MNISSGKGIKGGLKGKKLEGRELRTLLLEYWLEMVRFQIKKVLEKTGWI